MIDNDLGAPNPELSPYAERFSGVIETVETRQPGGDTLSVDMLHASMDIEDRIIIPGNQAPNPRLGKFGGEDVTAELTLGGVEANAEGPAQPAYRMLIVKLDMHSDAELRNRTHGEVEKHSTGFMLGVYDSEGKFKGAAFVPTGTKDAVIGRKEGSLTWTNENGELVPDSEDGKKWSPLDDNDSISRRQLKLDADRDVIFTGLTEKSTTVVNTRATEKHKDVVAKQAELAQRQAEEAKRQQKAPSLGKRVMRHVVRNAQGQP